MSAAAPPPAPPLLDRTFLTNLPDVTEIVLVRHGQQERPNGRERTDGEQPDAPLSSTGREQATMVGAFLADREVEAVYCSTLRRARETAEAIASRHDLTPVACPELREVEVFRDVPEGSQITDVASRLLLRGANHRFVAERRWDAFPFSETSRELRARVVTFVEGIVAAHRGSQAVIVCHGGVVNAYLAHVLGLEEDMFFHPVHTSVSRILAKHDRRVVHTLNESHHLHRSAGDGLVTY